MAWGAWLSIGGGRCLEVLQAMLACGLRRIAWPWAAYAVIVPLTISRTVPGTALVQTFDSGPLVLTGTAFILVLVYVVRRLPFGVRNASSMLFNIRPSIEEASISLGVTPFRLTSHAQIPARRRSASGCQPRADRRTSSRRTSACRPATATSWLPCLHLVNQPGCKRST